MSFLYNPLLVAPSKLFQIIGKSHFSIKERRGIIWGRKKGAVGGTVQSIHSIKERECVREKLNEHPRGFKASTYRLYILYRIHIF